MSDHDPAAGDPRAGRANPAPRLRPIDLVMAGVFALMVAAVSVRGAAVTLPQIPGWYAGLAKPGFTPPAAVFGPVWTMLFVMMALAAWRAWRRATSRVLVIAVFAGQLALNALWSEIFFGWQRPDLALAEIAVLWAAIVATILVFRRADPASAWLLAPYLAWVSFAAVLNFEIVRLNA